MKYEIDAMLSVANNDTPPRVIVNNASIVGHRGSSASGVAYTTAKHDVIGLTRQVAVEYANKNIRVNAVFPGATLTAATSPRRDAAPEKVNPRLSTLNPTGELVAVELMAKTAALLCSPAAQVINSHDIPPDGGQPPKL
jgi:NAD(P)-dependent dehydrogenase (short-subunit alcohol dehydrogenase family)